MKSKLAEFFVCRSARPVAIDPDMMKAGDISPRQMAGLADFPSQQPLALAVFHNEDTLQDVGCSAEDAPQMPEFSAMAFTVENRGDFDGACGQVTRAWRRDADRASVGAMTLTLHYFPAAAGAPGGPDALADNMPYALCLRPELVPQPVPVRKAAANYLDGEGGNGRMRQQGYTPEERRALDAAGEKDMKVYRAIAQACSSPRRA